MKIFSTFFFLLALGQSHLFAEQVPFRYETYERIVPPATQPPPKKTKTPVATDPFAETKKAPPAPSPRNTKTKPLPLRGLGPSQPAPQATRKSPKKKKASRPPARRPTNDGAPVPAQVQMEKEPANRKAVESEAVDLSKLNNSHSYTPPTSASKNLQLFFDLLLSYRPEQDGKLRFDNYHTALLIDYIPHPGFQFSMGFAPPDTTPRYYQVQYDINSSFQVRAGRIWIPFDQMNPHNTFGGIYNTSPMRAPNQEAFLPDIWTDLGLAAKWTIIQRRHFTLAQHFYVVNGFHDGGTDPLAETTSYPEFGGISVDEEKNTDKAIGGRTEISIGNNFGLGVSAYSGRYSDSSAPNARILMLGADLQMRFSRLMKFRAGYALMNVDLPEGTTRTSFLRGGLYGDLSFRLSPKWEFLLKGGVVQNDNGVLDQNDRTLVGARFNFKPNPVTTLSLEHHQDLRDAPGKVNKSYTALRVSLML